MNENEQVVKKMFSARLRDDDIEIINEALPEIFPDDDISELKGRQIFRGAIEAAVRTTRKHKVSLPGDTEKIKGLEAGLKLEKQLRDEAEQTIRENQQTIQALEQDKARLSTGLQTSEGKITDLEKYVPVENEMRLVFEPFPLAVLKKYAEKVSSRTKKEIPPGEILISLFVRYITKKETELDGFPFLVSNKELQAILDSLKKTEENNEPV